MILEPLQSPDQIGFRSGMRIEDAIGSFEILVSKISEFNMPLWIASLDLRKAFDRVNHVALFDCLRDQGVPHAEVAFLLDI